MLEFKLWIHVFPGTGKDFFIVDCAKEKSEWGSLAELMRARMIVHVLKRKIRHPFQTYKTKYFTFREKYEKWSYLFKYPWVLRLPCTKQTLNVDIEFQFLNLFLINSIILRNSTDEKNTNTSLIFYHEYS